MSTLICVQCTEPVDSLYVEYSPTNIRLTRCAKCGKVADKYIEYELLLVLLDAILHRKPAVRHLLYNRMNDSALVRAVRWVPLGCIAIHCTLRMCILSDHTYQRVLALSVLHAVAATVADQMVLIAVCAVALYCTPSSRALLMKQNKVHIKLYLSLVSPELLRGFALLLQAFDSEATLLLLFALLVVSLQFLAFQCLTNIRSAKLVACAGAVLACRAALKLLFYSTADIARLGFIM